MLINKRRVIGLVSLAIILLIACSREQEGEVRKTAAGSPTVFVDAAMSEKIDLEETIPFVGNIKASDSATLFSKVTGKLLKNTVREGQKVEKDQTVATVDRDEVGFRFKQARVLSTLSGMIGKVYLDRGADIRLDTPIALVVDYRTIRVLIEVAERHLSKVKVGQTASIKVDAYPEDNFQGEVWEISPVVDLQTRTVEVEISIDNPELKLTPGMFAKGNLVVNVHQDTVVAPEEAVVAMAKGEFVYVVKDGKADRRSVSIGIRKEGKVQIKEGLMAGETVITAGQQKVNENSVIKVRESNFSKGN